ncbi:MAG: hypothetical protein KDA94_05115 [Acidimicrobiales bacterium]|nr:hypothetical protein [Acidimicrobiales bacterium]
MRVSGLRDGGGRVVIEVAGERWRHAAVVELVGEPSVVLGAGALGDALLASSLLLAMRWGEPLEVDAPVSPRLLDAADTIQDIFCTWDRALRPTAPWYSRVEIVAPIAEEVGPERSDGRGTVCFFTGGVDSFHAALDSLEELDALVYVHGFDVGLDDTPLRSEVSARLRAAAAGLGVDLLEVETDLRALGEERGVGWPDQHGAALATVGLLLADRFDRILIPATHTYAHLEGLGSHPLLDPLWSTERVEVVHRGAAATRVDKVRALAELPAAREHLRVCWENREGAYNCGRCEKCVRTGVAVRLAGAEGRFPSIPAPSLRQVATASVTGRGSPWVELRQEALRADADPKLRAGIEVALARHQARRAWRNRPWSR